MAFMTTTQTNSIKRFPKPDRAPGLHELGDGRPEPIETRAAAGARERRRQRAFDGWLAGRIRKQSRRWRYA